MSSSYPRCYTPLNADEFRILVLEPGVRGAGLCCSLITQNLGDGVSYEALSYAWGDPTCTNRVRIGTQNFGVANNLYVALQYLRYETRTRVLWIDAICIDQANLSERSQQVQLMNLVYRGAECVLVWLGEQNYNSDSAFDILEKWAPLTRPSMYEFAHYFGTQFGISSNERHVNTLVETINLTAISTLNVEIARAGKPRSVNFRETIRNGGFPDFDYIEADANDLICLLKTFHVNGERPWWGRRWVVQEVMNGRKLEIICGRRSIPWNRITDFRNSVANLATLNYPIQSILSTKIADSFRSVWNLDELRARGRLFVGQNPTLSFEELLERFTRTRCSDPLDLIYSILNISNLPESSCPIDYSKSVVEVFSNITRMIIAQSRNLFHLSSSSPSSTKELFQEQWPTWMRDYSCLESPSILLKQMDIRRGTLYSAAGNSVVSDSFYQEFRPRVLRLKGTLHDTIIAATKGM